MSLTDDLSLKEEGGRKKKKGKKEREEGKRGRDEMLSIQGERLSKLHSSILLSSYLSIHS